jgi:hypothetical protein
MNSRYSIREMFSDETAQSPQNITKQHRGPALEDSGFRHRQLTKTRIETASFEKIFDEAKGSMYRFCSCVIKSFQRSVSGIEQTSLQS